MDDLSETVEVDSLYAIAQMKENPSISINNIEKIESSTSQAPQRGTITHLADHLETVYICRRRKVDRIRFNVHVDKSTLDESGSGKAYCYNIKECGEHYFVSFEITFIGTPVYLVATVAYNLIRAVIVPFYVLFQYLTEKCKGKPHGHEREFKPIDIPTQFILSLWRAIQAPFYALAFFLAGLYSFFDPMGGRKLGASIERDWNGGVSLAEGYWSIQGSQKLWRFEGGGGPKGLGRNGFYLAGCWQPAGVIEYKNQEIQASCWLPLAVDPMRGNFDTYYTLPFLEAKVEENTHGIKDLLAEREKILSELKNRQKQGK